MSNPHYKILSWEGVIGGCQKTYPVIYFNGDLEFNKLKKLNDQFRICIKGTGLYDGKYFAYADETSGKCCKPYTCDIVAQDALILKHVDWRGAPHVGGEVEIVIADCSKYKPLTAHVEKPRVPHSSQSKSEPKIRKITNPSHASLSIKIPRVHVVKQSEDKCGISFNVGITIAIVLFLFLFAMLVMFFSRKM